MTILIVILLCLLVAGVIAIAVAALMIEQAIVRLSDNIATIAVAESKRRKIGEARESL